MNKLTHNLGFFVALMVVSVVIFTSCKDNTSEKKEPVLTEKSTAFSPQDVEQIVYLYQFTHFDTKAMQIWIEKSGNEDMKVYAEQQLAMTEKNKIRLEAVASEYGIQLPNDLTPTYEKELYKYSTGGVNDYDKVFLKSYLSVCENVNDSINNLRLNYPNEEIKQLSQDTFGNMSARIMELIQMSN